MKHLLLSFSLVLTTFFASKAQNTVRVFNHSGCNIDVVVTELDALCAVVSTSAVTTITNGPNHADFTIATGNEYSVEVVDLWGSLNNIPAVVSPGCGGPNINNSAPSTYCTGGTFIGIAEIIAPGPPGVFNVDVRK